MIEKSIIIIGEISSGKSTLAKRICDAYKLPKASFGGYLLQYCKDHNLPENARKDLQNLGQEMIDNDARDFLKKVISFSTNNPNQLVFEGVRHKVIFDEISKISKETISLYVDATISQRLLRFVNREKEIDTNKTEEDFNRDSSHPVEKEIPYLKSLCSLIIQSADSPDEDFAKAKNYLDQIIS
jgi:cytidylate kinase